MVGKKGHPSKADLEELAKEIVQYRDQQISKEDWQQSVTSTFEPEIVRVDATGTVINYKQGKDFVVPQLNYKALKAFFDHVHSLDSYKRVLVPFVDREEK